MMTLDKLRQLSCEQWEALCHFLLPGGQKEGCRWLAGSINGEPGRSFDVNLRTGVFGDWASDDKKQRGPINLWMAVKSVDFKTAVQQFAAWFGCQVDIPFLQHQETATNERKKRFFLPRGLSEPTEQDLQILSRNRVIGIDALRIATARGFIYAFGDGLNGRCWLYTDQRRRCALRRRIDNQRFRLTSGSASKSAACMGSDMRRPIGYQEAALYPCVGIAEGGPNSLAILAHAWAIGVEERVAPVCMPSTTANFSEPALAYLQGKRARIFIDNDSPGHEAADRWAAQLRSANVEVDGFSFDGLVMTDSQPVKDLNDLLLIDYDCWEQFRSQVENIMNFAL